MDIVYRPVSALVDAEYNPRQLSSAAYESIKSSLLRFGFTVPALVNVHPDRENVIIGGHQRKNIVRAEHEKHGTEFDRVQYEEGQILIPCVERALTPEEERELNIRLNKNTGDWDWNQLENLFEVDDLHTWGFDEDELSRFDEDELEMPDELVGDDQDNPAKLTITFSSDDNLESALRDIEEILSDYPESYYSVSSGEL